MKNIKIPDLDSKELFENIVANKKSKKHKDNLENVKKYIFKRYDEYDDNKECLERVNLSNITNSEEKEALLSCYSRKKNSYFEGSVVKKILEIQSSQHKNKCPYCLIDKPRTIDHYLPKDNYPEFAVFPINLIPCCSSCNGKKGELWIENGERVFINYYFDKIPDVKFLRAVVSYDKSDIKYTTLIKFHIIEDSSINAKTYNIIQKHFTRLDLIKEYEEIVEEEISNIYDEVKSSTDIPVESFYDSIRRRIRTNTNKYGKNYWKVVLHEAILESNFINDVYEVTLSDAII